MTRVCDETKSLSEAINGFVAKGCVKAEIPRSNKATDKLHKMTKDELVEFVKYLYSPLPERA